MRTIRPTSSLPTGLSRRGIFVLAALAICLGFTLPDAALAVDNIGIFWDTAFTQANTSVETYPSVLTGYLVIKDPAPTGGVLGWELCVDVDGPAQFINWTIEGQAINVNPPPCFAVGISPDPLPADPDVLLATFQILVTDPLPIALSVRPDFHPSVPGQMSYIPADDPGALLPLTPVTGQPEVAFINDQVPNLVVSPTTLHFDNTYLGQSATKTVTVTNAGNIPGDLDVFLTGDCTGYSLTGLRGQMTVLPGNAVDIEVTFTPASTDYILCNLALGANLAEVQMIGSGSVLTAQWEAPTEVDFGSVEVGSYTTQYVTVRNIGDVAFDIAPYISASCADFNIVSGNYPSTISPGSSRTIGVRFRPSAVAVFTCALDLGDIVPAVTLAGSGGNPGYKYSLIPSALDFGTVGIGYSKDLTLNLRNIGLISVPLDVQIPAGCPDFSIVSGGGALTVAPGDNHLMTIRYAPQAVAQDNCDLDLGTVVPDVPMTGIGRDAVLSWIAPTTHDFGLVAVGFSATYGFMVTNNGDIPFDVIPGLPENTLNFELTLGSPVTLGPGDSTNVSVRFAPLVPGPHSVALDLGPTVPAVMLQGDGEPRAESWTVTPDPLDFGWLYVGTYLEKVVTINNTGGTFLDMDIFLADPGLGYTILSGGGAFQLAPGASHEVAVRFQPQGAGVFLTTLNLGTQIPPLAVNGSAESTDNVCIAQPDTLIFGPVNSGTSQTKTVAITNNGNQTLNLWPSTTSSKFHYEGAFRALQPGVTGYFTVSFLSSSQGTFTGTLDLGAEACAGVPLVGTAVATGGAGQDLVGIFFDPAYTTIEATTFTSNAIVEGYLVLVEPSQSTGVSAWELAADIDGQAQWLNWTLEGQHINVGTYNEFIVGIGGTPLPPSSHILLATFQIFIPEPYPNIVYLELRPTHRPSLPDAMVWAPGHDSSILLPMFPLTGEPVVAGINWGPPVGIGNPAPRAIVTGGAVTLDWPAPETGYEGFHVYRRDEADELTRLTDQMVTGSGSVLTYTDHPGEYGSGVVFRYSYSVVKSGVEGVRSPETEVRLAGLPSVRTQLLPNVPNPFNPMTEVHFELARPQQARVAIYDVTGRLVKMLADGQLGSGPHMRVWRGRDESGRQVPSGAYYVRLITDDKVDHHKIMLLK